MLSHKQYIYFLICDREDQRTQYIYFMRKCLWMQTMLEGILATNFISVITGSTRHWPLQRLCAVVSTASQSICYNIRNSIYFNRSYRTSQDTLPRYVPTVPCSQGLWRTTYWRWNCHSLWEENSWPNESCRISSQTGKSLGDPLLWNGLNICK